jgi:type I restriction enzyme S subunit
MKIRNTLTSCNLEKETIGSLCRERKETSQQPISDGFTRYIGLEHLQTDKVCLDKWGEFQEDTPSFNKVFRKGDLLLCKRRPYLRKASQVTFDGVCSSDIIVLQADEDKLYPEFLPHLLHTANFWNFAVKTSSGSLSPRTKFSLLKDFSIDIPSKKKQKELLEVIVKSMEIDILTATSLSRLELLIRAFKASEMSLSQESNTSAIGDFLTESRLEGSNGKLAKKLTVKLYGKGIFSKEDKSGSENTKYFRRKSGQFIYSKLDFLNGACAIIPESVDGSESTLDLPAFDVSNKLSADWLFHYVNRPDFYEAFSHSAKGGRKAKRISPKDFLKTEIPSFSLEKQKEQVEIINNMESQQFFLQEKLSCMRKIRQRIILGE